MVVYNAEVVNEAFSATCPKLKDNLIGKYPMEYERWLQPNEELLNAEDDGKQPTTKMFLASSENQGLKRDYVWCKHGPNGKGYYHLRTRIAHVNLSSRFRMGAPGRGGLFCCLYAGPDKVFLNHWDTTNRVLFARSSMSTPNDIKFSNAGVTILTNGE